MEHKVVIHIYLSTYLPTYLFASICVAVFIFVSLLEAFYSLDFCKVCYCLCTLRQLDCPIRVEPVEGYKNSDYMKVDLGGATADCKALQKNFPMASVIDCMQSGGGGGGIGIGSSGAAAAAAADSTGTICGLCSLCCCSSSPTWCTG